MRQFIPAVSLILCTTAAWPCTTVCMRSGAEILVGKNYDWDIADGLVVVNKRNVAKESMADTNPARWVSKYGSITFNQYGREFPSGGMNETGLVVELMWLNDTRYPTDVSLLGVGCLEWIQYQLDTASTIAEVIENASRLRIESGAKLHYLACDHTGACATIEYLDGRPNAHFGDGLPIAALTNNTYAESLSFARAFVGFGGSRPIPAGEGSLERFVRAASLAQSFVPRSSVADEAYAFSVMNLVAQGVYTQWSIVYDLARKEISFRTIDNRQVRGLPLFSMDFDCRTPVLVLDVQAPVQGDVTFAFREYTPEINRSLVERAYALTPFLQGTPPDVVEAVAMHPETTVCGGGSVP